MLKTMLSHSWRRLFVLSSLIGGLLVTLPLPAPTHAATDWATEAKVSQRDGEASYEPAVAVDSDGCTHAAWYGGATQDKWRVWYASNRNYGGSGCRGGFNSPVMISTDSGENRNPAIAVGSNGHVHVVASRRLDGLAEINYMESNDLGRTWTNRIRNISNSDGSAFEPSVAVDSDNNVYFAWIDNNNTSTYVTKYTMRINGIYGDTDNVSTTNDKAPKIVVTGSATNRIVHFSYHGRSPRLDRDSAFEIFYASGVVVASGTGAGRYRLQLTKPVQLTNEANSWAVNTAIASNGANDLYIAYEWAVSGNHDIYLLRSTNLGASWTFVGNLTQRPNDKSIASFPSIAFGLAFDRSTLTIAWDEGTNGVTNVFALEYYPDTNTLDTLAVLNKSTSDASRTDVAGNLKVNRIASAFQSRQGSSTYRVYAASRGGATLTAIPTINGGAERTNDPLLNVALSEVNGSPTQMRYALDRSPTDSDPWLTFQSTFTVTATDSASCTRTIALQVRNAQGTASAVASAKIVVDTAVTANVGVVNPGLGAPGYTASLTATALIQPQNECSPLNNIVPPLPADGLGGYRGSVSLADREDGPRDVTLSVGDAAGNSRLFNQSIIVDRASPRLSGGTLQAASGGLSSLLTDVTASSFNVSDTIYSAGYWGVQLANTLDAAAADGALKWQTFQLRAGDDGKLTVRGWSVASGLGVKPAAGQPIQVRLRFLDGAGNPSAALLTTVTLAEGYRQIATTLPLIER